MKIALLHADPVQSEKIREVITACGHHCLSSANSREMLLLLRRETCDMLIIDGETADTDGANVLSWARDNMSPAIPSLFLFNHHHEAGIAAALDAGASDYVLKPIRKGELTTRVRVLLHRAYPNHDAEEYVRFGPYLFEAESGRLTRAGQRIPVTQKEFELALLFFRNLGRPLSRATIFESVWQQDLDDDATKSTRTVDTHISRIRTKLKLQPDLGFRLAPVYSYGYRLEQLPEGAQQGEHDGTL